MCSVDNSNCSLLGDETVRNDESGSEVLTHLMESFTSAEKRLDDLHLELMELCNDSQADNEMVADLLEQCQLIVRKSDVIFETIRSDKSLTDNAKVRAKRRWCSVQERLSEIQGYLKCMKRMPVNATSVKVPCSSSSLNLVEGVACNNATQSTEYCARGTRAVVPNLFRLATPYKTEI